MAASALQNKLFLSLLAPVLKALSLLSEHRVQVWRETLHWSQVLYLLKRAAALPEGHTKEEESFDGTYRWSR